MSSMTPETTALTAFEIQRTGYNAISLTEWGTTLEPAMCEGSLLEVGSALFEARGGDLDIGDVAACGDGLVYFYCSSAGALSVSNTAPTWNTDKQGWYNGTSRCYGRLLKAGASYSQKLIFRSRQLAEGYQGLAVAMGADADSVLRFASDASIAWGEAGNTFTIDKPLTLAGTLHGFGANVDKTFSTGNQAIGAGGNWVPEVGLYIFCSTSNYTDLVFEIKISGIWYQSWFGGLVFCDGVNHRLRAASVNPRTVYYHKFDS